MLSMMIAELIFDYFPNMNQGKMTMLKISLENGAILPKYAKKYGFEEVIRLGNGQIKSGGANDKILEDVFEAFIGALYKDQGFEKTKAIIEYNIDEAMEAITKVLDEGKDLNNLLWEIIKYIKDILMEVTCFLKKELYW